MSPRKVSPAATIAARAWKESKGITRTEWANPGGDSDPDSKTFEGFIPRWQGRLIGFALAFWEIAAAEGLSPADIRGRTK